MSTATQFRHRTVQVSAFQEHPPTHPLYIEIKTIRRRKVVRKAEDKNQRS